MKKSIVACMLAMSMCTVPVYAADEMSASDVLQHMNEYANSVSSETIAMKLNLDAGVSMTDTDGAATTESMVLAGDLGVKVLPGDMKIYLSGDFDVTVADESQEMQMEMYMVPSDDETSMDGYMNMTSDGESSGWTYESYDMTDVLQMFGVNSIFELKNQSDALTENGTTLPYAVTATDTGYQLNGKMSIAELAEKTNVNDIIKEAESEISEDADEAMDMEFVNQLLDTIVVNMSYEIDGETFAMTSCHVDFNDSDLSVLNQMLSAMSGLSDMNYDDDVTDSAASPQMELILNDFSVDMAFTYDDVDDIVVPEEALSATENQENMDITLDDDVDTEFDIDMPETDIVE